MRINRSQVLSTGTVLFLAIVLLSSCLTPSGFPEISYLSFPSPESIMEQKEGGFLFETYLYKGRVVDMGTILVPENRTNPESRLIALPFLRYHADTAKALEPVFYLKGGPGGKNADGLLSIGEFFLDAHEVVFVGYRGIDALTNLPTPGYSNRVLKMFSTQESVSVELIQQLAQSFSEDRAIWQESNIDSEGYNTIEVVDDLNAVRSALGYGKVNIVGESFGTRLAYSYSLRYPESVNRVIQQGINPPGRCFWEKDHLEKVLGLYNQIWQADPAALKLSPDLFESWKNVIALLPVTVDGTTITREFLSSALHMSLYKTEMAPLVFSAMLAAEQGNFRPLARALSQFPINQITSGYNADRILKAAQADYNSEIDYLSEIAENNPGTMPYTFLQWAIAQQDPSFIKLIPEEYRIWRDTDVQTLLINGTLDPSSPPWGLEDYATHYKNGRLIFVPERSHSDVFSADLKVWKRLLLGYLRTGEFDEKKIPYVRVKLY